MKKMTIFSYLNISPMQNFYFSAQLLEFFLSADLLFPSDSPLEEPVRGAVAGPGIDSKILCNEGARKAVLDAVARASADNADELPCWVSS